MGPIRLVAMLAALILCGCAGSAAVTSTRATAGESPFPPALTPRPAPRAPERLSDAALGRPSQPPLAARFEAALVADHCTDRDLPAPASVDVALTVLDRSYALPASYAPTDLVPASAAGLTGASRTKLVRSVLLDDLAAMRAAWEAAGLSMIIDSAYRSHAAQAATFDSWVRQLGYGAALVRSARAGHSEHQLGTALDLSSPGWAGRFGDWAVETPEGAWMLANGWEYGFVMSYPAGSQGQTCFSYEPWHYRWIGREAASALHASELQPRQFLERFIDG